MPHSGSESKGLRVEDLVSTPFSFSLSSGLNVENIAEVQMAVIWRRNTEERSVET